MIDVGATGWSHDDWVGPFYPVSLRDAPEEWLRFYATRFRTVEVASTFDAFPSPELVDQWARVGVAVAERGSFEFSLKLPRAVTHDAVPEGDLRAAREVTGRFDREVLDPLAGEDLLGAVLVQLPPRLEATRESVRALQAVLGALVERRVALEFRHPSWFQKGCVVPLAEPLFASRDIALVQADASSTERVASPVRSRHAYVRFHGRSPAWARRDDVQDGARYDYRYDAGELTSWAEHLRELEASRREVRAYFNNAPRAQAPANALELMELLGQAAGVPRPRLTEQTKLPV